jgi:hypothetical protein
MLGIGARPTVRIDLNTLGSGSSEQKHLVDRFARKK